MEVENVGAHATLDEKLHDWLAQAHSQQLGRRDDS